MHSHSDICIMKPFYFSSFFPWWLTLISKRTRFRITMGTNLWALLWWLSRWCLPRQEDPIWMGIALLHDMGILHQRKREKSSWAAASISLCFLTANAVQSATFLPWCTAPLDHEPKETISFLCWLHQVFSLRNEKTNRYLTFRKVPISHM